MENQVQETAKVDYAKCSVSELALAVQEDWGAKVNYAAKPYLEAMFDLESVKDHYGADTGYSVVAYFLANASSWRGPVAKAVKAELNKKLKS